MNDSAWMTRWPGDSYTHLYMLNRAILITLFHDMALMSPAATEYDVDRHSEIFAEMADELIH